MDGNIASSDEENYNIDWNTDDELEIQNYRSSSSSFSTPRGEVIAGNGEGCSSAGSSNSRLIDYFIGMGFAKKLVLKAIQENGEEDNSELILETLLTYTAVENSPEQEQSVNSNHSSSGYDEGILDDFSDSDSWFESEETTDSLSDRDKKLLTLVNMGYAVDAASTAMNRCGPEASLDELTDCIFAAETAKAADSNFPDETKPEKISNNKKRKLDEYLKKKKQGLPEDEETIRLPNPMIGFGVPTEDCRVIHRNLPEDAVGPPYFYYENVALTPKGVWDTISRFLYGIQPEFVDSKFFCAAARKRGYVHNLPVNNRLPLLPLPPRTIHDALPMTRKWWPSWDTRKQLNCLQTSTTSAKQTERIRKALENWNGEPPLSVQKFVFEQCRRWNLVWVGRNKVAPLECDEVEMLLGFPRNHTRGGGISRTDRYKSLGNSFQVDTVAYHLSPLKDLFPGGINLLSLFSGIGGAEVALHRLGIRLKNVVSVEISEVNRNIVRCWWEQTNQKGNLIDIPDIQQLNGDKLEELMTSFGGFDLIVGGSPCNNLSGGNRVSRNGLEGEQSSLFYDYFRILDLVKIIMSNKQQ